MAHGEDLREQLDDAHFAKQVQIDYRQADLTVRQRAMLDYADKLTRAPGTMRREDVQGLRACGFQDRDILDIVEIIAYFNYINRVAEGLGVDPEPEWPAGE